MVAQRIDRPRHVHVAPDLRLLELVEQRVEAWVAEAVDLLACERGEVDGRLDLPVERIRQAVLYVREMDTEAGLGLALHHELPQVEAIVPHSRFYWTVAPWQPRKLPGRG